MDFLLRNTANAMGGHEMKWQSKTLLGSNYADDLSILDENVAKRMIFGRF